MSAHVSSIPLSISSGNYAFLQRFIYSESGIVVDADKQYLLDSRLQPIVREARLTSLNELSELLAANPHHMLASRVVDAMTTNETLFFRDRQFFDALRSDVFPELFSRIRGRKVRIWSAAASTGQEAYSLAMTLLEMGKTAADFEIVGTDISRTALDRARSGCYIQFEVNRGLPAPLLMKYFTPKGTEWLLHNTVRSLARFTPMDLRQSLRGLGTFDMILCRNVLIYFDDVTKQSILASMARQMNPEAYLGLGCSESTIGLKCDLDRQMVARSAFYRPLGDAHARSL